jgi:hypothetical protein
MANGEGAPFAKLASWVDRVRSPLICRIAVRRTVRLLRPYFLLAMRKYTPAGQRVSAAAARRPQPARRGVTSPFFPEKECTCPVIK